MAAISGSASSGPKAAVIDMNRDRRAAALRHPVYLNTQGARVSLDGLTLEVRAKEERRRLRLDEISALTVLGNVQITTPALQELMRRGIPVEWMTASGWYLGATTGFGHGDGALRAAQHAIAADPGRCLVFARPWVEAKLKNCRTLLRRNGRGRDVRVAVRRLADLARRAAEAGDLDSLRGFEGAGAAIYFRVFPALLRGRASWAAERFRGRRRRPPTDPANAALSFAYAVQTRAWSIALSTAGLDVFTGFLHGFRHGRPALALDLLEPSRPRIAESAVLRAFNTGALKESYIEVDGPAVRLGEEGRRAVLEALENRLDQTALHDGLGREIGYRDLPSVEAGRLAHSLRHDEQPPAPMNWR